MWIAFSTAMISTASIILGVAGLAVLHTNFSASHAGLVLAFASDASIQLFALLDRYSNLESDMVCVERIHESKSSAKLCVRVRLTPTSYAYF